MHIFQRSLMILLIATGSITATLLGSSLADAADGSSFDAQGYFNRLNRDNDKYLEVNEMNPRARRYVQQLGFDPTDKIRLRDLMRRLDQREEQAGQGSSENSKPRDSKIATFGVDLEKQTVPSFGKETTENAKVEYSDATIKMANEVMARYDGDKNGLIDAEEIQKGRWGRPEASVSDQDGDGALSRSELLNRYHQRELEKQRQRNEGGEKDQDRGGRDQGDRNRSNDGDSGRGDRESAKSATTRRSPKQQREQYRSYAKGLIKRYDKDKDGRLNATEWKAAKRKPAGTDRNKDGFIDVDEYASALLNESNPQKRSNTGLSRVATTAGGKTLPAEMAKRDANQDAQVQMHEYTSKWSDTLLAEFYAIDTNGDGVITPGEWQRRSK